MRTTHAVLMHRNGGPEVLRWEKRHLPEVGPADVCIRQKVIGLNFIDIHHRTGRYPSKVFPLVPGVEAAGIVETVGSEVREFKEGERVAYVDLGPGAYTERRVIAANRVVRLPDKISDEMAAAVMLKGLTAQILIRSVYPLRPGDTILVHAAAGGVGLVLCQWARHLGAKVIGTVGSAHKAALAAEHGCHEVIHYKTENALERVRALTDGRGVDAVFDGVGADTFETSLAVVKRRGTIVSYGTPSGAIPPFDLFRLNLLGSLWITSPSGMDYMRERDEYLRRTEELFQVLTGSIVQCRVNQRYPLAEAARAHIDLETRRTTGSSVLVVGEAAS